MRQSKKKVVTGSKNDYYKGYYRKWKQKNPHYWKEYYKKNKDKIKLDTKYNKKGYDREHKNMVRENLIRIIEERDIKKILTLESPDFLFSKLIPQKKIIVFENDRTTFNKMKKGKPKNVKLFYGDVSEFAGLDAKVDCVYLDFYSIFEFMKEQIHELKEVINNTQLFIVTFALRIGNVAKERGFTQFGDYQFDLIRRLQELLEINFKVLYGEAYKDTMPMVTIAFENPDFHNSKRNTNI